MTVNTVDSIAEFDTNGVTTNFPFYFKFLANEDLVVTYVDPLGVSSTLSLGTHYTVNGAGVDNGGSVVTNTALAGPGQLVVSREMEAFQQTSLRNQGKFLAETHEDVFDKLTMLIQQGLATFKRALTRPFGRDYFFAENRRIASVKDPVEPQDAATKNSVETYVSGILETGQGPVNNAANIIYVNGAGVPGVLQGLVGGIISEDLTVLVPAHFAGLGEAMNWLRTKTIAKGATVTVQVSDGSYTLATTVDLNHPQGIQIRILGNQVTPTLCVLTVANASTFDALACTMGHSLGFIDGFLLTRPSKAEMPNNSIGLLADSGAKIITGSKIRTSNWFYGIAARYGSFVLCPGAQVTESGDVGIWSYCGSTVICDGAVSNNANAAGQPWGFGFQAEYGSVLVGTGISASGCKIGGFASLSNSTCRIFDSTTSANDGSGLFVRDGGVIEGSGTTTLNNGRYGTEIVEGNGRIFGVSTNSGNTLGAANPFVYLGVQAGQSQLANSSGHLRIDSQANTFFNTPGGLQFGIRDAANAANRIEASGAPTGSAPFIVAAGGDTNINLRLLPKGTGRIQVGATTVGTPTINNYIEFLSDDGAVLRIPCQRL